MNASPHLPMLSGVVETMFRAGSINNAEALAFKFRVYCYTSARSKFDTKSLMTLSDLLETEIPTLFVLRRKMRKAASK